MEVKTNSGIIKAHNPVTYEDYLTLIEDMAIKNRTSGQDQTEEKVLATKINLQRMKRIGKDTSVDTSLQKTILLSAKPVIWMIITEAWCGDAAQNLPIIQKVAGLSNGKIKTLMVFRDDNPALMNEFLTKGTQSIPVLLCLDAETGDVLGKWGPRPKLIQDMVYRFKEENPRATHHEIMYQVHLSYFHNKGKALQYELTSFVNAYNRSYQRDEVRQRI